MLGITLAGLKTFGSTVAPLAGSALSGLLGIGGNQISAERQYQYQSKLQQAQQNWLENMSNTAHQREMADLRAAGLNPLLTAMGGTGASTPSAGMGSIGMGDDGDVLSRFVANEQQYKQNLEQIKNTKAQTNLLNEQGLTEITKRMDISSQMGLRNALRIGAEIDNNWKDSKYKNEILRTISETAKNYTDMSLMSSELQVNKMREGLIKEQKREVYYRNFENRLRGYEAGEKFEFIKEHPYMHYGDKMRRRIKNIFGNINENPLY